MSIWPFGKKKKTAADFWSWFGANSARLYRIEPVKAMDEISREITRIHPDFVLGIEKGLNGGPHRLDISAGGIRAMIPEVQTIVAASPQFAEWKIQAFRPPSEGEFEIEGQGQTINLSTAQFTITGQHEEWVDIQLFLPLPADLPQHVFGELGFALLDHPIGEYTVMTRIGEIQFEHSASAPPTAQPLVELRAMLSPQ